MSKLNQKQLKLLSEMSTEQLTNIISELVEDNRQTKHLLISNYLSTPDESLKKAEAEYNKKIKTKRFYDYYDADAFFDELHRKIALPLEKTVSVIPEKTEVFCQKLLLTFNKLNEIADTSSGCWMIYYNCVVDVWLKSLSLQRDKGSDIISDKIMTILKRDSYFKFNVFDRYKKELGYDVIRSLRERLLSHNDTNSALELSIYIRDVDFIRQEFKKEEVRLPEYTIKFAELLVDELCAEEAIAVLNKIRNDKSVDHSGLRDKWTEIFIQALIEEGEIKQAREYCLEGFKNRCNVVFYNLYNKIDPPVDSQDLFAGVAKDKGFPFLMLFLSELKDYEKLDFEIVNAGRNEMTEILALFRGSFIRSLSGDLYRHGYAYSATFLRRILVEDSISRSQSKYYSYAASDMKKAIDYSKNVTWTALLPSTEDYFKSLFMEHKRKYALWEIMQEKIDGLSVGKDSISYIV